MRPYRVRVDLRIDLGTGHSAAAEARLRDEIMTLLRGQVGGFLQLSEAAAAERLVSSAGDLDRLANEQFVPFQSGNLDKILLASVDRELGQTVCRAREWDATTRGIGPLVSRSTPAEAEVSATLVGCLRAVFRPVAVVEQTKEGVITLHGRGTHSPPHDPAWAPLATGTVFEPYYRYLTKERQVDRIQRIPWTYLVCGEHDADQGTAGAAPVSGLRTAISARRRRIEAVALGVPIGAESTTVRLRTRPPARRPIVGVEVLVQAERYVPPPAEGQTPPPPLARLVSDRRGEFKLPTSVTVPGKAVWLFVYSGSQLLGRVPMVPGLREQEELELSDDSLRLQVEGDIALLQARLVDLAAQKAVQIATARKRAGDKDFAGAEELIKRVEEGIKPPALLAELNTIRSPALKLARDARDKQTEARIKKLCDDTAEIITVHFGPEGLLDLRDELTELKEIAEDEANGVQPRPKTPRTPRAKRSTKGTKAASGEPAATESPATPAATPPLAESPSRCWPRPNAV
ncbi:MAG: hypothetical protein ACKOFW_21185 [Planctomycetaceae bacterium]